MSLKTFDPKDVIVTIGGAIMGGYADGTFVGVERAEDAFSASVGADGETTRVKSNNKMTMLTLTLAQTSDSNSILSALAILDEKTNQGVVPVVVKEINGDTLVTGGKAWIRKIASIEYGKEIATREWVIDIAEGEMIVGGNVVSGIFGF
ncbi:MAG: DUF3277 family protein [Scytonema sp. CRU_2_7]|nr:DUF3277 family protein [Scytonema sp. CRU_2_7]